MATSPIQRVRKLALGLPEAHEVEAWGEPTFRVRNKLFAMFASAASHHGSGRYAIWCKAAPGNQELMVKSAPSRFFVPPYVGPSGWIGVWLGTGTDWQELAVLLEDSWRLTAPKRLVAAVSADAGSSMRPAAASRGTKSRAKTIAKPIAKTGVKRVTKPDATTAPSRGKPTAKRRTKR